MIGDQIFLHALDVKKILEPLAHGLSVVTPANRLVVIDPGHGGVKPGTQSVATGNHEKEYTLDWAKRLAPLLEQSGWRVILTRTNDANLSIADRVTFTEARRADLFISLHFNTAGDRSPLPAGLETYCFTPVGMPSSLTRGYADDARLVYPNNAFDVQNLRYAVRLHAALLRVNGNNDRGVRHARFLDVLAGQNRPSGVDRRWLSLQSRGGKKDCRSGVSPKTRGSRGKGPGMSGPKHILVTGGAGFIGSHLVERLLTEGNRVVVLDDFSTGSRENLTGIQSHPNLRILHAKISTCAELPDLVAQSESIFHLAAAVGVDLVVKSPIHVLATNQHETEVLLAVAAKHRVPTLVASTSEVYGKSEKAAFSEEDDLLIGPPHHSRWGYACSKLMDEFLALAYARECELPVVIARMFNTVGPASDGSLRHGAATLYCLGSEKRTVTSVRRRPAKPLFLLRVRHRGSVGAIAKNSGGEESNFQHRQHGGSHDSRTGAARHRNAWFEIRD